jgi:hypothetical protein
MEHVNKALAAKPFALGQPLQLIIDKQVYKYDVIVRTLIKDGHIHWHGAPLITIATDLTHSELIEFVNRELIHPSVQGWRVQGGGSPSREGLLVRDFIKPHLSDRQLDRLAKGFKAKVGAL